MLTSVACEHDVRTRRVLLVEDEILVAMLIADQLAELGYFTVGPALSMLEARHLAAIAPVDLGLIDLNLRGEFAGELIDILASRKIPCLVVTGYPGLPDGRYADIPVLSKPFSTSDLERAMAGIFLG